MCSVGMLGFAVKIQKFPSETWVDVGEKVPEELSEISSNFVVSPLIIEVIPSNYIFLPYSRPDDVKTGKQSLVFMLQANKSRNEIADIFSHRLWRLAREYIEEIWNLSPCCFFYSVIQTGQEVKKF